MAAPANREIIFHPIGLMRKRPIGRRAKELSKMTKYWGTFRIAEKVVGLQQPGTRRTALYNAIRSRSSKGWEEPTSFLLFESAYSIDQIAAAAHAAIAPSEDLFLVRQLDAELARVVGKVEDRGLFAFMPYAVRYAPALPPPLRPPLRYPPGRSSVLAAAYRRRLGGA